MTKKLFTTEAQIVEDKKRRADFERDFRSKLEEEFSARDRGDREFVINKYIERFHDEQIAEAKANGSFEAEYQAWCVDA